MSLYFKQSFGVTWRKAILSIPRLVPDSVLYLTSPEGPHPIVIRIPSRSTHRIPLYIFVPPPPSHPTDPNDPTTTATQLPVLLDFHGGGFVFGSCHEQAPFCSKLSRELHAIAISVDYRLGPASRFPAAIEDAEDVVRAILKPGSPGYRELRHAIAQHLRKSERDETIDETRLAVSGFSSGGNVALNLGLSIATTPGNASAMTHDWPSVFPPAFPRNIPLLLFYPSLDCTMLPSERPLPRGLAAPASAEKKSFLKTLDLESSVMRTYLPLDQVHHPRASPGLADIKDGGLHPKARVLLVLPELDTLAAQSDVWIEKLAEEGRSAHVSVEKIGGVVHGWTQFPDSFLSEEHRRLKMSVFDEARDFVARSWAGES